MTSTVRFTGALEPRSGWKAERCTIAKALEVVSTRSALLIMREAFYGTTRFDDFAERVGISEPVAAARLRELVEEGLLEREDYREPGQRTRQQYRLTPKGADLFPVLVALMQWGDRWAPHPDGRFTEVLIVTQLAACAGVLTTSSALAIVQRSAVQLSRGSSDPVNRTGACMPQS